MRLLRTCVWLLSASLVAGCGQQNSASKDNRLSYPAISLELTDDLETRYPQAVSELRAALPLQADSTPLTLSVGARSCKAPEARDDCRFSAHPEGYRVSARADRIEVQATSAPGALAAMTFLTRQFSAAEPGLTEGVTQDWPLHQRRGVHLGMTGMPLETIYELLDVARQSRMNFVVLELRRWVRFDSDIVRADANAISKEQLLELQTYAAENGLELIPQLVLLTHQQHFLAPQRQDLLYNFRTYDPRNEQLYAELLPYIDEVIDVLKPRAIHIGHDEVVGIPGFQTERWKTRGENYLPAELFVKDVNILHEHLSKRGVETWMWGDMLLSIDDFGSMNPVSIRGRGEYRGIASQIPADITICDWHYSGKTDGFPSARFFADRGHSVMGSTWLDGKTTRDFSAAVAELPGEGHGMLATTWWGALKADTAKLISIIRYSGKVYWEGGD